MTHVVGQQDGLWIDTANLCSFRDTCDSQHVGSQAHITGTLLGFISNSSESAIHNHFKLLSNLFNPPEEALQILYPLKVTYCDASGIRQDVRNDYSLLLEENFVSFRSSRAISSLRNNAGLDAMGVSRCYDAFGCRWDQNITRNFQHILYTDILGVTEVHHSALFLLMA